jgi:SAM-dependent methyltransferase
MSPTLDTRSYLDMERAAYSELVARSDYSSEAFTRVDTAESVVGWYAQHEAFDYERWLLGGITLEHGALALEYGCGPGRMLLRLARHFSRVDGVDISPEVIEVARRRCQHLPHRPLLFTTGGDGVPRELDRVYDVAFSVICLQHICVYSVRRRILEGLFRALKPGGLLTLQMGYGPGHAGMVDYFEDFVGAAGTNGAADVGVLHPSEIAGDLQAIGFQSGAFALTPTGPGDTHGAWIFVRALKPGPGPVAFSGSPDRWAASGFVPLVCDERAAARARSLHQEHGLLASRRDLRKRVDELEQRGDDLASAAERLSSTADALAYAQADAAFWNGRAAEARRTLEHLERRLEIDERQMLRLRVADRGRIGALIGEVVRAARESDHRLGVFGAGTHTEYLLRETALGAVPDLFVFDSDPALKGRDVRGRAIHHISDAAAMHLNVVVISSLAFQDEMAATLESLNLGDVRVVRCYP